jgi:hypothetical protein
MRNAITKILMLLVIVAYAAGQESKPSFKTSDYPPADFTVTHQTVRKGTVEIMATQVKPEKQDLGRPLYCRAWVDIKVGNARAKKLVFPDIDPVAASYGLFMPQQQPIPGFLFFEKHGDYDGRLYLVDASGRVTNLKGGWFFLDPSKRYLFSEYGSDSPEITVFDLKEKRVVFNSKIPTDVNWYQLGERYAFLTIDEELRPHSTGLVQLKVLDLQHRKLQDISISDRQLQTLPKVESPVAREAKSSKDCEF